MHGVLLYVAFSTDVYKIQIQNLASIFRIIKHFHLSFAFFFFLLSAFKKEKFLSALVYRTRDLNDVSGDYPT